MRTTASLLLSSALLLAAAIPVQGQVWGGPRVGVSISNLGGDDAPDADSRTGMVVGWSFSVDGGPRWGFQPEFHYWEKGADARLLGFERELDVSYLDIPLLLRLDLSPGSRVSPHVLVGPTVGINLTCELRTLAGPITGTRDCDDSEGFSVKTLDLGVGAGFGVSMDMGTWKLLADARYGLGLSDIFEDVDMRNRGFGITAGASFPLTR